MTSEQSRGTSKRQVWRCGRDMRHSGVHMTREIRRHGRVSVPMMTNRSGRGRGLEGHRRKWLVQRRNRRWAAGNGRAGGVEVDAGGRARVRRLQPGRCGTVDDVQALGRRGGVVDRGGRHGDRALSAAVGDGQSGRCGRGVAGRGTNNGGDGGQMFARTRMMQERWRGGGESGWAAGER